MCPWQSQTWVKALSAQSLTAVVEETCASLWQLSQLWVNSKISGICIILKTILFFPLWHTREMFSWEGVRRFPLHSLHAVICGSTKSRITSGWWKRGFPQRLNAILSLGSSFPSSGCFCQETNAAPKSDSTSSVPCSCWLQVLARVPVTKAPGAALLQIHSFGQSFP